MSTTTTPRRIAAPLGHRMWYSPFLREPKLSPAPEYDGGFTPTFSSPRLVFQVRAAAGTSRNSCSKSFASLSRERARGFGMPSRDGRLFSRASFRAASSFRCCSSPTQQAWCIKSRNTGGPLSSSGPLPPLFGDSDPFSSRSPRLFGLVDVDSAFFATAGSSAGLPPGLPKLPCAAVGLFSSSSSISNFNWSATGPIQDSLPQCVFLQIQHCTLPMYVSSPSNPVSAPRDSPFGFFGTGISPMFLPDFSSSSWCTRSHKFR
mmetsp:Transcript_23711/g.59901  ORF Transcript_23711/g.59901 Transcript_23711/m.59901 type:complete len:261 (-) Transcript_23711:3380-4162(-)